MLHEKSNMAADNHFETMQMAYLQSASFIPFMYKHERDGMVHTILCPRTVYITVDAYDWEGG